MKFITQIEMPQEYLKDWLKLLLQFDQTHSGCNIESYAEGGTSVEEVEEIMRRTGYEHTFKMRKQ
jgi:hypothetical protein